MRGLRCHSDQQHLLNGALSCSATLSEKSQQQGTHLPPALPPRFSPWWRIQAPCLHRLLGHWLAMLWNTSSSNRHPQLRRTECGGDLFLLKRQSTPVLLSHRDAKGRKPLAKQGPRSCMEAETPPQIFQIPLS
ncbi:hypothetical protein I79_014167 [Cricetulus griseus]|uniref:Uncharacterized protein n=1 Tax=Cricetulus griseus TaxID=10029 RepID=G3HTE2_CRIGR|nr:hypothetical protein I79_014167 [Cricetulus griseus]